MSDESVEKKIEAIQAEIAKKNEEASKLLSYLTEQQTLAKLEEEKEEDELKRQGIIVGQHIPSLPSKLNLDPSIIAEYETYASNLLISKDLIQQNRTNFLRRTGNLPISELAESKRELNMKTISMQDSELPHYLLQTGSSKIREDRNSVRFSETIQNSPTKKEIARLREERGDKPIRKDKNLPISAKEKLEHENVLKSINHKLNYLRNPRNNPNEVTKMLVKPKAFFESKEAESNHSLEPSEGDDSSSITSRLKSKYSKVKKVNDNPLFVCEPRTLLFEDYEIGKKYTHNISFRNISAVSRTVRILAPKSKIFSISPLRYPVNCNAGVIAPGICVSCTLTFIPEAIGDFEDTISVETEGGSTSVQIIARREPPQLSISSTINAGTCLVGDASRSAFVCSNLGGTGRFTLMLDKESPLNEEELQTHQCLRLAPFTIYPIDFSLSKGDTIELVFEFVPLEIGNFSKMFYIRCDNGQIRQFTVNAIGKQLNISSVEINGISFDDKNPSVYRELYFHDIHANSEKTNQLTVCNDTGIPIEYEWVWMEGKTPKADWHLRGQQLIQQREESMRLFSPQESNQVEEINDNDEDQNHQIDHTLLRSIKQSFDASQEQSISSNHENFVKRGPYEIFPARGILAGEGACEFSFVFNPMVQLKSTVRAVMMVKNVPLAALPDSNQIKVLNDLKDQGHGKYFRLRSWLEDIGNPGTVVEYTRPNGSKSNMRNLIQLTTLISLVLGHIVNSNPELEQNESLIRFHRWLKAAVKHCYDFRRHELLQDDISSVGGSQGSLHQSSQSSSKKKLVKDSIEIDLYDWNTEENDVPTLIFPIQLTSEQLLNTDSYDSDEEKDNQDTSLRTGFTIFERQMMSEIWLDSTNSLKFFGDYICNFLNEKVQHEAIDYIKDCNLNHLAGVQFLVHGESISQEISLTPPIVTVPSHLSIGKVWEGQVSITNNSPAPLQLNLLLDQLVVKQLNSDHFDSTLPELPSIGDIDDAPELIAPELNLNSLVRFETDYQSILLMSGATEIVKFNLSINKLGQFQLLIPIASNDTKAILESLSIEAFVQGPSIRFDKAEIDIGLLGVGQEERHTLSFKNEGDVPLMFMMKPTLHLVDNIQQNKDNINANASGINASALGRPDSHRDAIPLSGRSTMSRKSSARSDDYSVADSTATSNNEFKIELKNAMVLVEPSNGIVEPNSSFTVEIVTKAGKVPQRIRGMIESRIFDFSGKFEVIRQYLNLRGEIQTPKVLLYPNSHQLGHVYVTRPVKFQFFLENISNLDTKFKFLRPGGNSNMFSFVLTPNQGTLQAKEKLSISGEFTATNIGVIDDMISCKLFGLPSPLGFNVKAIAKGLLVEFISLPDNSVVHQIEPLATVNDVQFPSGDKVPEPQPLMPLVLGHNTPLYERRRAKFVLRNLSSLYANYEVKIKKYFVMEKPKRFGGNSTDDGQGEGSVNTARSRASTAQPEARNDLILQPQEDGIHRFQSRNGQKYIEMIINRREDRKFLYSGYGASYYVDNVSGQLSPWGVTEFTVYAFNDIPGVYHDDVEVTLTDASGFEKTYNIPIEMTVTGCPIIIEKNTVGMTTLGEKHCESELNKLKNSNSSEIVLYPREHLNKPLLQLGEALEYDNNLLTRSFFVKNFGSKIASINWTVRGLSGKAFGSIKCSINVLKIRDSDRKVKTSIRFWDDIAKESPFVIEPKQANIKPYEKQSFTVKLTKNTPISYERAQLTAKVKMLESSQNVKHIPEIGHDLITSSTSSLASEESHNKTQLKFALDMLVEGKFVNPAVMVDKHTHIIPYTDTVLGEDYSIKLSTTASQLFSGAHEISTVSPDICSKLINIKNILEMNTVISVSTEGPFSVSTVSSGSHKGGKSPPHQKATAPNTHRSAASTDQSISVISSPDKNPPDASRRTLPSGDVRALYFPLLPLVRFLIIFNFSV